MSNNWMPYPENEPEEEDVYLVAWDIKGSTRRHCFVELQHWEDGEWKIDIPQAGRNEACIYAWMPLPELYIKE